MLTIRPRTVILLACLIEAAWLLVAQTLGSKFLLLPCLACFLVLVAWASLKGIALPVLLFFLPFAALLKTAPGQTSFFTVALLITYTVCFLLGYRKIGIIHVIPAAIVIGLCLLVKTMYGYQLESDFLIFSFSLVFAPYVAIEFGKRYDFFWLTMFFSIGIILASISSLYLIEFSNISRYIRDLELFGVVRHSGYYGDPNFYSAHISAAIAGILILLLNNSKKMRMIQLIVVLMLLTYCGFLAVSKMFTLIVVCLFLFFVLEVMFKKGKMSLKVFLLLTFVVGTVFLLSFATSSKLIEMILSRFSDSSNISDFTTGRTDVWLEYFRVFRKDTILLLFGKGFSKIIITTKTSHNTLIQLVFQFGLIGFIVFVGWLTCLFRICLKNNKVEWNTFAQACIILLGVIGPWLALDMLFFDEMFLMPMYVCIGLNSIAGKEERGNVIISRRKRLRYGHGR